MQKSGNYDSVCFECPRTAQTWCGTVVLHGIYAMGKLRGKPPPGQQSLTQFKFGPLSDVNRPIRFPPQTAVPPPEPLAPSVKSLYQSHKSCKTQRLSQVLLQGRLPGLRQGKRKQQLFQAVVERIPSTLTTTKACYSTFRRSVGMLHQLAGMRSGTSPTFFLLVHPKTLWRGHCGVG